MPKSLLEVQDEYSAFKSQNPDDPTSLQEFAKQLDEVHGTPGERAPAYDPHWYNKANALVDRGFRATHLPEVAGAATGAVGSGFDSLFGTHIEPTVRRMGEDLPRMVTEAALTIPEVASGAGAPVAAAMWANRLRKLAGYTGTALSGYDQTNSLAGAGIAAGSMGLSNKLLLPAERGGIDVMGKAAGAIRDKLGIAAPEVVADAGKTLGAEFPGAHYSPTPVRNALAVGGGIGAEATTQLGVSEATRQAQLSVGPNAVGLTDSSRNPLTEENVAGNIAGLAPFALHGALALRNGATGFDQRQAQPLVEWIKNQRQAVEESARTADPSVPVTEPTLPGIVTNPYSPKDTTTLRQTVKVNLDAARAAEVDGRTEDVQRNRRNAADALRAMGEGEFTPESAQQATKEVAVQATTGLAMSTPDAFGEFVQKVNKLIAYYNDNWAKVQEGEVPADEVNFTKGSPTQSSHPQGSHPEAVARLQKKGLLPEITPEWLREQGRITEEALQTMDPRFFNDVLAQKVANHLLDNVPEALLKESQQPPSPTIERPRMLEQKAKMDAQYKGLIDAISDPKLPPEIRERLVDETAKWQKRPEQVFKLSGAQKIPTIIKAHPLASWIAAVDKAVKSYSPIDQTIDLGRGRGREPFSVMWGVPYKGSAYIPSPKYLSPIEGGKGRYQYTDKSGKTHFLNETNIEDLPKPDSNSGMDFMDESELAQDIVESGGVGMSGMKQLGHEPGFSEGLTQSGALAAPVDDPTGAQATAQFTKVWQDKAQGLAQNVAKMSPESAYSLLRPLITSQRLPVDIAEFHKTNAKTIIAALKDLATNASNNKDAEVSPEGKALIAASPWKFSGGEVSQVREILDKVLLARKDPRVLMDKAREVVTRVIDPKAQKVSEGWKGPMMMSQEGAVATPTTEGDLLAPRPTPGAFSDDAVRTITAAVDKHFGSKGYSGDLRAMYQAATMAIVKSMKDVPLDFYKLADQNVAGLANENLTPGRGQVGVGTTPIDMETSSHFVHRALTALTHELAHIDDFVHFGGLKTPDAYSEERARQLTNLRSMYDNLDEDQRHEIFSTLDKSLTPPGYRTAFEENSGQKARSVKDADEFSATVMTLVTQSLLFGKKRGLEDALKTLDFSPTEVQDYAKYQYRAIRDVLQAIDSTPADVGAPFVLRKALSAVTAAAIEASRVRDGAKEVAAAQDMVKAMDKGASTVPAIGTESTWYRRQEAIKENFGKMAEHGPYAMANSREAMQHAADALGVSYDKTKKPGLWARWFYPFGNLMYSMERSGVDLARPLFNLVNDTESAVHRRYTDIVSPFIKQRADGTRAWDDDHPLIKSQTPAVRRGINEVSQWQSENGHVPMFVEQEGQLVADTAARPVWEKMRGKYSPADQQTIVAASVAMDRTGQNMARHTLSVLDESMTLRTARLLQMLNKRMTYDQAFAQADAITKAYQSGDVGSLNRTTPPGILKAVDSLLGGATGLKAQFDQVKALLDSRPGYRTEQLPHDWIVMYKTPEGETKFSSAPTEKQAHYMAGRLQQQGNQLAGEIVNKSDLRSKYQAFDDPDALLQKFSQVEGRSWDRAVDAVRAGFGNEVAEEVRASYTPGAASLKDVGTQGFAKFLKGGESQVDRGSFDYLDAMLARAARLSASASYKTHGAMKDLILNDPRGRMFPSLSNMVNEHWENMLSPTSDLTKKVKAMATGYYLGANLSSAAVEGSQSLLTVIPTLIAGNASGGPVKAYGQLMKSIANATEVSGGEEWKRVAKATEAKVAVDPEAKLTDAETRALMYKRAVADGVIGHGVVQDLLFSRDQKTLQTAKFGQGDYGPVPLTDLATNKLYLGAQLLTGLYAVASKFNDKISFFAGLNQGIEKGLTGDELYNHARQFKTLSTFGGGKANAPGWVAKVSNVHTRSAVGMVNTLQQYGYGMVAMMAQYGKDSIDLAKNLSPQQRTQARRAFGTMLATQVAVGGVLGVPFAGAALTLLEKQFGIPANQAVREGLASLGSDDDAGGVIAESVLNGLGNQMFGLDVSSRVGVSNLLGTSSYRGFDVKDMLGPVPGLIGNMADALNWFGQNEPAKAFHSLVPTAFKQAVAMYDSHQKYGDYAIRDSGENLLSTPTDFQNTARLFGFRTREESQRRQAESMVTAADKRLQHTTDSGADEAARALLSGNPQASRQYALDLAQTVPGTSASDVLRGVMERAVGMTSQKDLLAQGGRAGAEERRRIMATFGSDINERQSEMGLTQLRTQLASQLGVPELIPQGEDWQKAALVDSLVKDRGVTRTQALAMVQMMMHSQTPSSLGPRSSPFGGQ